MLKTAVIGPGRWGTTNAWILSDISEKVFIFGEKDDKDLISLKEKRENDYIKLKDNIKLSSDINEVLNYASDFVCVVINGQNTRELFEKYKNEFLNYKGDIVLMMKSLEKETGMRLSKIYEEVTGRSDNLAVLVGPAHPQDLVNGLPTAMVVSGTNQEVINRIEMKFNHPLYRLYWNEDLIGVELGAALKNTIGIMAGILSGLNMEPCYGILITRGPIEVSKIVKAYGGEFHTPFGLSHLGDYAATVFSHYSFNFQYGKTFAMGEDWDKSKVAEGSETILAVKELTGDFKKIDTPIHKALYNILYNGGDAKKELAVLFEKSKRHEFWD